jgi:hypothetical protein
MKIRRPEDIAVAVRDARRKAGLSQVQLAERLEVNRVLVALGIVLRALNVLGLSLALESEDTKPATAPAKATSAKPRPRISIDEIVDD